MSLYRPHVTISFSHGTQTNNLYVNTCYYLIAKSFYNTNSSIVLLKYSILGSVSRTINDKFDENLGFPWKCIYLFVRESFGSPQIVSGTETLKVCERKHLKFSLEIYLSYNHVSKQWLTSLNFKLFVNHFWHTSLFLSSPLLLLAECSFMDTFSFTVFVKLSSRLVLIITDWQSSLPQSRRQNWVAWIQEDFRDSFFHPISTYFLSPYPPPLFNGTIKHIWAPCLCIMAQRSWATLTLV